MRTAAIVIGVLVAAGAGFVIWERSNWTRERDIQCASAQPLISAAAPKDSVLEVLGKASVEFDRTDWPEMEKDFATAQSGEKLTDIKERLPDAGQLLVYSRSNSIMFLYLDAGGRASHASCFLQ